MSAKTRRIAELVTARFRDAVAVTVSPQGEVTAEVPTEHLIEVAAYVRDADGLRFDECVDVCGVDYLGYGQSEWVTDAATGTGFSRGVGVSGGTAGLGHARFAVVLHLLSVELNQRLRLRAFCPDDELPIMPSVVGVWPGANWFEREAFDLFGILFEGHPDLRRLLTDYGFIGHPFRKDFPLIGNVEVRYDPDKGRVAYQPVSIVPRVLVPRVIRNDHRYELD